MEKSIQNAKNLINEFVANTSEESGKNTILTLVSNDQTNDKRKFNNLIKLGNELIKSLDWFDNIGATKFREFTGIKLTKANYFETFFDIKKAWAYRLMQAAKIDAPIISNYLETDKNPSILGLINFVTPNKHKAEKSEILVTFNDKKLSVKKGSVKSTLSIEDINKLIIELQKIKATFEAE